MKKKVNDEAKRAKSTVIGLCNMARDFALASMDEGDVLPSPMLQLQAALLQIQIAFEGDLKEVSHLPYGPESSRKVR